MRKYHKSVLFMLLLLPVLAMAAPIKDGSLNELLKASGLSEQVDQLPGAVKAGLDQAQQQGSPIPAAEYEALSKAMVAAFAPKQVNLAIKAQLKKKLSQADAKQLMAWYKSKLGKKITKAEEKASTPQAMQAMMAQAQSLVSDQARLDLAIKIVNLVKAVDMGVDLQMHTSKSIVAAMSQAANPGAPVDMQAIETQLAAGEVQMRDAMQQFMVLSMLYSYKELSVAEIKKYVAFLEKPVTQKFNNTVIQAMSVALASAVDNMAKSMASIFKKHNKS
ncbi:MAG: DUF2059 domain-containing protein [Gammaproteobacteria bacterium]|nr:DUF2059 domain-containing protein [Gammaproteobacteria bacterium]MDH5801854.1 DUF2059 domain-containing protein [Gammaproteobacteria bacterium]